MAAALLRRLGYIVLTATDGLEALTLKQQRDSGHVDLLLTDIVMPHMSGRELADRIRTSFPRTKILFTSAYTESAAIRQGIVNQDIALLQKPFTPSGLARKIRDVLDAKSSSKTHEGDSDGGR
jgi:two-component system cell cycle sensor histidine kinase/response regulator CckA